MPETIVITGASSGIGRELALQLAGEGVTLHLLGQTPERVAEVAKLTEQAGATVRPLVIDLTDFGAVEAWYRGLGAAGEKVDTLYHCVGRNTFGEVAGLSMEDLEWVYRTNLLTTAQWMSLVYPDMVARGEGTIVLLSSLSAYSGFPMATPYASTKQALLALARSVWPEADEAGVKLHVACPGFIKTRIFEASRFTDCDLDGVMGCIRKLGFPIMPVDKAARVLLRSVRRGKRLIVFPFYAKFMALLGFRFPGFIDIFHRKVIRMLNAAGRPKNATTDG